MTRAYFISRTLLPGARACAYEDMSTTPCENHVKHCKSAGEAGQCVYKGICCNPNGNPLSFIYSLVYYIPSGAN